MCKKLIILLCLLLHSNTFSQADWTIFAYIEGSEGLKHQALYNMSQMALGGVPEHVNMFVQIHTGNNLSFFYKIEKNHIILLDFVPIGANAKENILQTLRKILPKYSAKHFGLILWDNGFGILEPKYNEETETWDVEPDGDQFAGCDLMHNFDMTKLVHHKGVLINAETKTIMGNADMVELVDTISTDMLEGKKIDLFAMDCCMGAMVEHGYQLHKYVHYLVGSQDCELSDGFDYVNLMAHFNQGHIAPEQIAKDIVYDYGNYNAIHATVGRYTMSATDLSFIPKLKTNIDHVSSILLKFLRTNKELFKTEFLNIRLACPRFCMIPSYTDLYTLYDKLSSALQAYTNYEQVEDLLEYLNEGRKIVLEAVIANVAGKVNKEVHGLSIYSPFERIDKTYPPTLFAKESTWFAFIQELIQ